MTGEPTAWAVSHWWDEPWSRGAWSLLRVGASPATRQRLGEPVSDRLIIVGEATHPEQAGMTHGAFEEGQRAAAWAVARGHRRVVVVGAGAAGLGAARSLADGGVDIVVVEARERIGGRIHSTPVDGLVGELGANWLQQGERNTLLPIARRLGLTLVDTDFGSPLNLGPAGVIATDDDDEVLDELRRRVDTIAAVGLAAAADTADVGAAEETDVDDISLGELRRRWLADTGDLPVASIERVIAAEVFLDAGAPLEDLSARYGFEPGVGEGDRWIRGGYRQILDELATGLDCRLGWPVDSVIDEAADVRISGPAGALAADAVIVTVPVAVLLDDGIRFTPPLPDGHLAALGLLTVGRVEKVVLRFDRRWWPISPSRYLRIFGPSGSNSVSEWLDITDEAGAPMIAGLFVGDWVEAIWEGQTDAEIAHLATEVLATATRAAEA